MAGSTPMADSLAGSPVAPSPRFDPRGILNPGRVYWS
jgi:hypothetical protein